MGAATEPVLDYFREERFRTPLRPEQRIGLWVDRIGSGKGTLTKSELRILGQYAAVYVDQGKGECIGDSGEKNVLRPGDVFICFPEVPSTYYSTENWKTYWIVWNGDSAHQLERAGYLRRDCPILKDAFGDFLGAYNALMKLMENEDLVSILERKIVLLRMLEGLFRHNHQNCLSVSSFDKIEQAVEYLSENYAKPLSINEISNMFMMSPTNFRRLFKKYSGKTPKELIETLRISRAKELLSKGHSVKTVASEIGYTDVFYFMKVFKRATSMTTSEFRSVKF